MEEKNTILIVDDEPNNLTLLELVLKNEGYKVELATDGKKALSWTEKKDFDLILLDIMMPELSGLEVCSQLKNNPKTSEIPVIFLTALSSSKNVIEGLYHGAIDYITKPFVKKELLARIYTHLQLTNSKKKIKKLYEDIAIKNKDISESINYAKRIQKAVLPTGNNIKEVLPKHFLYYKPRDIVSGDLYWIKQIDKKVIVSVGDGTGHGVPGAFMSLMGISSLNAIISDIEKPNAALLLKEMRSHIKKTLNSTSSKVSDCIDMAFCVFDYETKELTYAGAKIPLILVSKNTSELDINNSIKYKTYQANGNTLHYISGCKNIAKFPFKEENYHEVALKLSSGDRFYLFSDGYIDQFGGKNGRKFTRNQLIELIINATNIPIEEQNALLEKKMNEWMQGKHKQVDDMTVLGFEIENMYGEVDFF